MKVSGKDNKGKKGYRAIFLVALIVFLASSAYIASYYIRQSDAQKAYEKLQAAVETQTQLLEKEIPESEEAAEPVEEAVEVEIPVDFEMLKETNPDIYAWIHIPGTEVDYPIVQSPTDDSYYLNHTIEGVKGLPGSIYTESLNNKEFTDPNTLIYGHNMRNRTMFGGLHSYADNLFFQENPDIYIYTPKKILKYEIFAAYTADDRHILKKYDFEIPEVFQGYLDSIFTIRSMGASFNRELELTSEDKIITLSTCNSVDDQRWLVQAVLIEGE